MRKSVSLFLAFAMLFQVTYPTQVFALTGGPSQPEVQSFEPVGTSDMVDLFSGDFNYNIPLLDVEGYPINIAYHSGIGMDQEASWVGLGWNINPGVINRNMRGLPDDFSGDKVVKQISMKPNKTWGVAADINLEVFGYGKSGSGTVNVGASFGFNYNNYTGPSINVGTVLSLSSGCGLSGSLGINSSSDDGLTIQPSIGFSSKVGTNEKSTTSASLGINIGTSFNSRAGLKQLSINTSFSVSTQMSGQRTVKKDGVKSQKDVTSSVSMGNQGVGGTFDFGTPTSTPSITNNMKNNSYFFKASLGGEIFGIYGKVGMSGSYSSQELAQNVISSPAYGYLYSENGQEDDKALMDFNREKDGAYNENMAALPVTNYTFDTYGVSGQGVGGSYRPFRSEVGYVYDPAGYMTNDDVNVTTEVGIGNLVHLGTDIAITDVNGKSGKWKSNNEGISKLKFHSKGKGNDFENVYFKEANEKGVDADPSFYADAGYDSPISPSVDLSDPFEPISHAFGPVKRKKRDKRTQSLSFLKRGEYNDFALKPVSNTYAAPSHHIAEVTTLATDGSRYVYGIAAYNTLQKDVTFSVGSTNPAYVSDRLSSNGDLEATEGLIGYSAGTDNTLSNKLGIDNFFVSTTTPAYAHSYLLTSVLSPDYIDADAERGPSDGDFGSYTRFAYKKISGYKWRTPFEKASYTEGLKSDRQDDKANYIYGEKELWYLDSVITKNYVAVFHTSARQDGVGVKNENGGYGSGGSESKQMLELDSISLYSKADLRLHPSTALPIKRVHFEYSYGLCKNIPNSVGGRDPAKGKLTLKKIYFSYQGSNRARTTPYIFDYHESNADENPSYNLKGYDRWGNYKPNTATSVGVKGQSPDIDDFVSGDASPADFPYVNQDQETADQYASVWSLKEIQLPSGGKIKLTYESDDYAYVQNKQAMQMFKITNINDTTNAGNTVASFMNDGTDRFYFRLQRDVHGALITDINKYTGGVSPLYFRFLVKMKDIFSYDNYEYVSGYGEIDPAKCGISGRYGYVGFKGVELEPKKPGSHPSVNPIIRTAVQFARLYMSKKAYASSESSFSSASNDIEGNNSVSTQVLNALIASDFVKNIKDAIAGPNEALYSTYNVAHDFVANKSWVRLLNPNHKKLGGGLRIKKIEMSDEWDTMTGGSSAEKSSYGQEYDYTLPDGTSSGVASYEPQLGGDENPFRKPLPYEIKKLMVPNDEFYQEEPYGESFFPTPGVGYSSVTVKNISRSEVTRHATGKVVHEFYTAKDFPTITKRSDVNHRRGKDKPFSLAALLKINVKDYLTAAQGFVIELNDMHGKPKSQKAFQEGNTSAISSVTYKYQQENYKDAYRLRNSCSTISKDGTVSTNRIGEFFDMVADFREDKTTVRNISVGINVDINLYGVYPVVIPTAWPSFAKQKTRFRSATSTKVIQRFGILEETVATDLGSTVATKNIAYDAETGSVLLTETTTNFNDKVYSLKYPAWWYYESMGPAYQNIGYEMGPVTFTGSTAGGTANVGSSGVYFREGDELELIKNPSGTNLTGWVKSVSGTTITVVNKAGLAVTGSYSIKIIRSGNRNVLTPDMATITLLNNPLNIIKSNIYQNVLQAGAVEFTNERQVHCDCIGAEGSPIPATVNPYVNGTKGYWRPLKSYTHLANRSQSNYDNNTNIRKDGVFTSYLPFYRQEGSGWKKDGNDWTYVSQVTEYNQFGEELENKDALGRYSSATFGYNQSMALSVAANTQYKEQGFDGFEDHYFNPCADDHFKFLGDSISSARSHTGKYSMKVSSGAPITLTKALANCITPNPCTLSMTGFFEPSINITTVVYIHGTAPYNSTYVINSGSPIITITPTGIKIKGTDYNITLTCTDSNGCVSTNELYN